LQFWWGERPREPFAEPTSPSPRLVSSLAPPKVAERITVPKTACAGNKGVYDFVAIMKLKRQSLVSQGSISRMLQAAEQAWELRDFQQNIEILERASRLDPANPSILLQLGRVYGLRYNYIAAEQYFDRAIRLAPNKTEALATASQASLDFASHQLTEHYFQQALEQKDATAETFARLAELYERLRRLEDATRLVDRALQLDGVCPLALLARARLGRMAGRLEEAERMLRTFPPSADRETRIRSYYELGMVLDRQKRYDEAMAAFLQAKVLLSPDAPPLLTQWHAVRAFWKEMQANISDETLKRWFDFGPALQPIRRIAFLGGYPRSGTTLLEQVLDSHPDVISAEETTIFLDDVYMPLTRNLPPGSPMLSVLEAARSDALQQSRRNYFRTMESHLGNPVGDRLLIDKNPAINFLIPAFLRVFPETKLLVALRDPRDVCLSCFMQAHLPLSKASVAFLNMENTTEAYAGVMGLWRTLAPMIANPYLEVCYEDVVDDLEAVSRRVLDFLGVPWDACVLRFDEHARAKRVRSPTYADVAQPVFKRAKGRWHNYRKYLEPYLEKLEPFVKAFGYE
jgi:tetratricopeptide (TPR) repeat protein